MVDVGVLAAFYSKSPKTPCSIFLGHFAVLTLRFFQISPTSGQSDFLLKRAVRAVLSGACLVKCFQIYKKFQNIDNLFDIIIIIIF